jgi:hypothetical protein
MFRYALLALPVIATAIPVARTVAQRAWCPPGWNVVVSHRYGNIVVTGEKGRDSLSVEARVRVDGSDRRAGEEFARDIGLSLASWAETLFVNVLYPELPEPSSELSYEVDLVMAVPSGARLEVTSSFGDVAARGLTGGCRVEHSFGNVLLASCRDSRVVNRHGDVEVSESYGGLLVNSSYGNVYLDGVQSRARVDNCYGNVEGTHLDGDVTLANVMGRVVTRDSRGQLVLVNRYGEVEAWVEDSALANLDVQAELSRVQLNLARAMPYRLGGRVVQGAVQTGLPVVVREHGPEQTISGQSGQGGPQIQLVGSWADFVIGPDSTEDSTAVRQTDRGEERR